jgi:hypothetical protein
VTPASPAAHASWLADDPDAARPHLEAVGRAVSEVPWCSGEPGEVLGPAHRWAGLPTVAPRSPQAGPPAARPPRPRLTPPSASGPGHHDRTRTRLTAG